MAAITALCAKGPPVRQRRLTLVVVRFRAAAVAGAAACAGHGGRGPSLGLGLARPCDECSKVICALGCFRRVVYSTEDGRLVSVAPEALLQECQPSSGKRLQRRAGSEAGGAGSAGAGAGARRGAKGAAPVPPARRRP
ncbi:unnamed protein product [Prorocentrum cordatum]|uniref:Uncharacterized protein n=1 Tax=Prorocentrum cordatum TaxID=2364126 RepID=A0ABN9QDU7_9DINO|nr:unnamed protein product [Polarella glacialis]